jgi:two-component system sensor histidine kinase RpfC
MDRENRTNALEKEQSIFRQIGLLIWCIYLFFLSVSDLVVNINELVMVTFLYLMFSIFLSIAIEFDVFSRISRRLVGIVGDISLTAIIIHIVGIHGVPLFCVFLWVTIGNGFRYGQKYLVVSSALSLLAFLTLSWIDSYWLISDEIAFTGLLLLIVVPAYLKVLLNRLMIEKERTEKASREKTRFIANVSHEIRTPLNAIIGLGGMISKVGIEEQREIMTHIENASMALMGLVESVLDISKIESGKVSVRNESYNPVALFASVESIFAAQIRDKGLRFIVQVDDGIPPRILGDQQRLRQVLINLVGNAVKFTETGSIRLDASGECVGDNNELLRITVSDTGIGMTDEFQRHIFDRFRQENETIARRYGGTGLGTAISRQLVRLMGGEIGVQSVFGKGSKFWITLPLVRADALFDPFADSTSAVHEELQEKIAEARIRILVVEDCDVNRLVYRTMFRYLGIETDFAETGIVALEYLAANRYDMLVFDMQIPGMSGDETIARYQQLVAAPNRPPIVVITGDATDEVESRCTGLGVSALLSKPVTLGEIKQLVGRLVLHQDPEPSLSG